MCLRVGERCATGQVFVMKEAVEQLLISKVHWKTGWWMSSLWSFCYQEVHCSSVWQVRLVEKWKSRSHTSAGRATLCFLAGGAMLLTGASSGISNKSASTVALGLRLCLCMFAMVRIKSPPITSESLFSLSMQLTLWCFGRPGRSLAAMTFASSLCRTAGLAARCWYPKNIVNKEFVRWWYDTHHPQWWIVDQALTSVSPFCPQL